MKPQGDEADGRRNYNFGHTASYSLDSGATTDNYVAVFTVYVGDLLGIKNIFLANTDGASDALHYRVHASLDDSETQASAAVYDAEKHSPITPEATLSAGSGITLEYNDAVAWLTLMVKSATASNPASFNVRFRGN